MPRITWSRGSIADLDRLARFLLERSPATAERAVATIEEGCELLRSHPDAGRLNDSKDSSRDWSIPFGSGSYIVRYQADPDQITIIAVRHSREADFDRP